MSVVCLNSSDVPGEYVTSIIRVEELAKQETRVKQAASTQYYEA
jgi:hypothetical protein